MSTTALVHSQEAV